MYIKISYHHGPNWMLRVRRVIGEPLNRSDKHVMYVFDSESTDCFPFSVGHAGEGDELRHCILEGTDASFDGWKHDFTFYAYKMPLLGSQPYAVAHMEYKDCMKYRIKESSTPANEHGWIHDLVFYAYSGKSDGTMLISIGSKGDTVEWFSPKLALGIMAKDDVFEHVTIFKGFSKGHLKTQPISVGHYGDGSQKRYMISKGTHAGPTWDIWQQDFTFYAFVSEDESTTPLTVSQVTNYWGGTDSLMSMEKMKIATGRKEIDFTFHVHPFDRSLLLDVAVGFESEYWCYTLKQGVVRFINPRFEYEFTFCGFKSPYPGTVPISIGKAGAEHNNTLRNRVDFGNNAGDKGWEHEFIVYVFPKEEPGTIPIAVGHADFVLGGWKYRVCENCKDAGTKGLTHDFVFYAYPHPP